MKCFSEQFRECSRNNICEIKKLDKPKIIDSIIYGTFVFESIIWCKRFNCKCSSNVCQNFRKAFILN